MLLCWCPFEKLNTDEANSSKTLVTVTTAWNHVSDDINVQAKDTWWSHTGTVVRRVMTERVKTGECLKDKRKGKEIQQRRFWRHYRHYFLIFLESVQTKRQTYERNVQEKLSNENEVCKSLNLVVICLCSYNQLFALFHCVSKFLTL